jgi:hypothetical protein
MDKAIRHENRRGAFILIASSTIPHLACFPNVNGHAFAGDPLDQPGLVRALGADHVEFVDDGGFVERFGEFEPLAGGGVRGGDGEIDIRGAAGVAGGAGAEEAHLAHPREAAKGVPEHGEIAVAKGWGFHAFSPIPGFGFCRPCHRAGLRGPARCAGRSGWRAPRRRRGW